MKRIVLAVVLALASCAPAGATVASSGASGFLIRLQGDVKMPPEQAFAAFTRIGEWWSSEHTFSGDAKNMSMDLAPGGGWREAMPGGFVEHMRVTETTPGQTLVLSGGLGPLHFMGVACTMTVRFTAQAGGTSVILEFAAGGYDPDGFAQMPGLVDEVLSEQFTRFTTYANQ